MSNGGAPLGGFGSSSKSGNENVPSSHYFSQHEEAKEDDGGVSHEKLSAREIMHDEFAKSFHLIDQEKTPCILILNEFFKRANTTAPFYYVVHESSAYFRASVSIDANNYIGERANTGEQAKENAARIAVKSILETGNSCLLEVITLQAGLRSKTLQAGQPGTSNVTPAAIASIPSAIQGQPLSMMPVLPHQQMLPPCQAIPAGNVSVLPPGISANDYQDGHMILEDEQILPMSFLPTRMPCEMNQMMYPAQTIPSGDDNMMVDEEHESFNGKKRKPEANNEGPVDKQARTV